MTLKFPDKPEVPLANPPLTEVICQVRYPPILRIAKEDPSEFQERIRDRFPGFGFEQPFRLRLPGGGGVGEPLAELPPRLLRFTSLDEHAAVTLAVDFYALSTSRYTHWRDFLADLSLVHEAVVASYRPAFGARIGLRYVNRLSPSTTGLSTMQEITALVRPELTAMLRGDPWNAPEEWLSQLVLADGDAKLALRLVFNSKEDEPFLQLDFDYFEQGKVSLTDLGERVERYHSMIYRAFRWCLLDDSLVVFGGMVTEVK
jgi:uncharacterized protein (TIGR04255 family)